MPRAQQSQSPALLIQVEPVGQRHYHVPGDTIVGRVIRQSFVVNPGATVTIRLYGRAKSKLTIRRTNGNSQTVSHYRGRFNFWNERDTAQCLFRGPIHIPKGGSPNIWPFALRIPTAADPRMVQCGNSPESPSHTYIPLDQDSIATSKLPGTFFGSGRSGNKTFEAYVEYYLEAELRQESQSNPVKATYPLRVVTPSGQYPVASFGLQTCAPTALFRSYQLVPGMENVKLSFKEKAKKFFESDDVPHLEFALQVQYPTVLQLGHPDPIPLLVRVLPKPQFTSEILADVAASVALSKLELRLRSETSVQGQGSGFLSGVRSASDHVTYSLGNPFMASSRERKIQIPVGPDAAPLDLGALIGLKLDPRSSLNALGWRSPVSPGALIYPTFETYCIRHKHQLAWEIQVTSAGETAKFSRTQSVTVLAPAEFSGPPAPYEPITQEPVPPYQAEDEIQPAYEPPANGEVPPYKE